jgi:hypothetical protein
MTTIKVKPGEGYRLLGDDEKAIGGDEYLTLNSRGESLAGDNRWYVVYGLAGRTAKQHGNIVFRRKAESTPLDQHFI